MNLRRMNGIVVNADNGRGVAEVPFGIACYAGTFVNGHYRGRHQGVVGTDADVEAWLQGEQPERLIRVFDAK